MKITTNTEIFYYSGAVLLSALLSVIVIFKLSWPATAEIPLCLSIFIQLIALVKTGLNMLESIDTDSLPEALSLLRKEH